MASRCIVFKHAFAADSLKVLSTQCLRDLHPAPAAKDRAGNAVGGVALAAGIPARWKVSWSALSALSRGEVIERRQMRDFSSEGRLTNPRIEWIDLGLTGYDEAFAIQAALHERRRRNEGPDTIIFQENFHTITLGRSTSTQGLLRSQETLRKRGVIVRSVSRGGEATYHGPGQLVISPILKLEEMAFGVHRYVRLLERTVIGVLAGYGIKGKRAAGASGVWLGDNKIAAVGIAVKSGITQHGIAVNVCPDLSYFDYIIPCGLRDKGVTSIEAQGAGAPSLEEVRDSFLREFSKVFKVEVREGNCSNGGGEGCYAK